jgi:hypothetical protein
MHREDRQVARTQPNGSRPKRSLSAHCPDKAPAGSENPYCRTEIATGAQLSTETPTEFFRWHCHLQRVCDPMALGAFFDQSRHSFYSCNRVIVQPQRKGEIEHQLRIRRALNHWIKGRIDRQQQVSFDNTEVANRAVVHPQPFPMAKRVAVCLLNGCAR